ncbi:MAG: hypothetical protein DA407_17475 [Bacteroidetes bacterium]|nr:MAG: hypothetical protein DA407_17475 [Bacteroidota bacterium]
MAAFAFVGLANAAGKTYTENEFLDSFGGESKKTVMETLGKPAKTQLSVKPTDADKVTGKKLDTKESIQVKVEMWYYNNIVKYDPSHTYKEVEITFVNDRVGNIAFFNNR